MKDLWTNLNLVEAELDNVSRFTQLIRTVESYDENIDFIRSQLTRCIGAIRNADATLALMIKELS
jgi:hypothetical protein